ncbi:HAD family hydrolase [Escherichia coli]|jgi:HAD superfamily hydrolase (TIGR01490 family)
MNLHVNTSTRAETKVLSVFDFDGTLTRHDSFIPFLRFAFGNRCFTRRLVKLAMPSLRCLGRKLTRDELKETLISTFLTGIEETWVQEKAELYCDFYWERLMRASGLLAVASEVSSGVEVTLCSASPRLVLSPFAERLGIKLIGTELESVNGILTGRITGHNCRCIQKINRLESIYGSLDQYHLRAWGDTRGDYELLAAAKDAHWRHFHSRWDRKKAAISRLKATSFKD